jgi:hypothetical protein
MGSTQPIPAEEMEDELEFDNEAVRSGRRNVDTPMLISGELLDSLELEREAVVIAVVLETLVFLKNKLVEELLDELEEDTFAFVTACKSGNVGS